MQLRRNLKRRLLRKAGITEGQALQGWYRTWNITTFNDRRVRRTVRRGLR